MCYRIMLYNIQKPVGQAFEGHNLLVSYFSGLCRHRVAAQPLYAYLIWLEGAKLL